MTTATIVLITTIGALGAWKIAAFDRSARRVSGFPIRSPLALPGPPLILSIIVCGLALTACGGDSGAKPDTKSSGSNGGSARSKAQVSSCLLALQVVKDSGAPASEFDFDADSIPGANLVSELGGNEPQGSARFEQYTIFYFDDPADSIEAADSLRLATNETVASRGPIVVRAGSESQEQADEIAACG